MGIEIYKEGVWQFATKECELEPRFKYLGWCKMGPIVGTNPINEPGEHVWFQNAPTREECIAKLKTEIGLNVPG